MTAIIEISGVISLSSSLLPTNDSSADRDESCGIGETEGFRLYEGTTRETENGPEDEALDNTGQVAPLFALPSWEG